MASLSIFRSYLKTPFLLLLAIETCIVFANVIIAGYIRFHSGSTGILAVSGSLWPEALVVAIVTPLSMLSMGLYQGKIREGFAGIILRIGVSFFGAIVLTSVIFYFVPELFLGRGILAIAYIQSFFVIGTLRVIFLESVDSAFFKKQVLVYGAGHTASNIDAKLRRKSDRRGFNIIGYVQLEGQELVVSANKLVDINGSMLQYAKNNRIDEIVVAASEKDQEILVDDLVNCKLNGILVVDILSFFEREAGQVRIDIMDTRWLVTSDGFYQSRFQNSIKRVFDIVTSVMIFIISAPLLVLITIAIIVEDGIKAQVFYSQIRVGERGETYRLYKFRSMRHDAEMQGEEVWATESDDRITRVGKFIRKTRLDEFPQILNVLNGTMSFVGPRPERPKFVAQLAKEIPFYNERHLVKPGVTGWAQLLYPYGSSLNDAYEKQLYDMFYVKNHSIFLDCLILLQTIEVILLGKGAR